MKEILAEAAYRAFHHSLGRIPDYEFPALPIDQKQAWADVAFAVLIEMEELALEHIKLIPKEDTIQ